MANEVQKLQDKLAQVFAAEWASENHPHYAELFSKFLFHMTDAAPEICKLAALLRSPGTIEIAAFRELLLQFFVHTVPHIVAAGQLYGHVPEIFPEQRGVHTLLGPNNENLLKGEQ